jgi:cell wall-associated NlpC family hydrolase
VANGFNTALQTSAGLLAQFNTDLSALMTTMHANGIIGGAGGIAGVASGMNFGNSLLGLSGAAILGSKLLGGGAGGALGAAAGRAAGAVGGAAGGGGLAATLGAGAAFLGPIGAAALLGHMIGGNVGKSLSVGSSLRTISGQNLPGQPEQHLGDLLKEIFSAKWGSSNTHPASVGGGAASVSQSLQTTASSNKQLGGGVTGQSVEAVHAAKSQIGVPYVYGDELPGVGFDCSGLVQWAYKQAGVNLPRTSQAQWAALSKSRSIPTGSAREGDLVFMAGSDGSYQAPGHVGLMISDNQLIQAPYTGANVQVIGYNPKEWQHAGRPTGRGGSLAVSGSGSAASAGSNTMSGTGLVGNSGMGIGGSYGSTEEADAISSALSGGGTGGVSLASGAGYGAAASGSGTGGPGASSTNPGGSASKNMAIAKMLAAKYGWTGQQWSDLDLLWMRESSWSNTARNASGAYGIPQALPASKLPLAGRPPSMGGKSNAGSQITWGLEYIKGRYGNPAGAWAHEESAGWYAAGGMIGSNMSIVGERGPELMIGGKGGQIVNNAQTMSILKAIQAQPAQTPWSNLDNMTTQPGQQNQMQGNTNLNFGNNSVVITVKSTGSDASASGREIAKSFTKWLEDEDIYESIRKGHKNG